MHERLDHLSVELEFMHFLTYKEVVSRCHDGIDKTEIVVDAQKKFVKNHIGRWVPLFCRMLAKRRTPGLFKLIADCMSEWMDFEVAFLGVTVQPYSEADYRPATFNARKVKPTSAGRRTREMSSVCC